ncbi:MAG TPA: hypothetical protein VK772_07655 [Puia sp.]|jgi:hypothetical protein|nr:hypothetical protein [Puia sp.]
MKYPIYSCLFFVFILELIGSCGPPERKKMPAFSYLNEAVSQLSLPKKNEPFIVGDTTINNEQFFSISIPNGASDSMAFRMLRTYQPVAKILYDAMIKQGDKGVVIDLCNNGDPQHTTNLNVTFLDQFSLPVVLIWNFSTESRVAGFINKLSQLDNFKYTVIRTDEQVGLVRYSTEDCFRFPSNISAH